MSILFLINVSPRCSISIGTFWPSLPRRSVAGYRRSFGARDPQRAIHLLPKNIGRCGAVRPNGGRRAFIGSRVTTTESTRRALMAVYIGIGTAACLVNLAQAD